MSMSTASDQTTAAPPEAPTERLTGHPAPDLLEPRWPVGGAPRGRYLLLHTGEETELVPLTGDVTHLGRGVSADVRIDDHLVSRRHAIIVVRATRTRLIDDRSANGVVLNGRVVTEAELHDGDVMVLGRSVLRYLDS